MIQAEFDVNAIADEHDVLVGLQEANSVAQISNVPLLSSPYSQTRIQIVAPGVRPIKVNKGISPFALETSSHAINDKELQVPEYAAAPASIIVPVLKSISTFPVPGTVIENQTSLDT